jgi:hypothetical protein
VNGEGKLAAAGRHPRNTGPMKLSPRCGARTRGGGACRAPAVSGRARCRMHGGAVGSGAPRGNQNALKSGLHTAEARAELRRAKAAMRETWASLADL